MQERTREKHFRLVAGRCGLELISRSYGTTSLQRLFPPTAPGRQVLEPRQCRLAHQVGAALGRAADSDLHGRNGPQRVHVIAVFVSRRDHDHPRHCHLAVAVPQAGRIAIVTERSCNRPGQIEPFGNLAQYDAPPQQARADGVMCP